MLCGKIVIVFLTTEIKFYSVARAVEFFKTFKNCEKIEFKISTIGEKSN